MRFSNTKKVQQANRSTKELKNEDGQQLSLTKCKDILGSSDIIYSDEEVQEIRDFFYRLAAIAIEDVSLDKNNIVQNSV